MHLDAKKRRSFVTPLFVASNLQRYVKKYINEYVNINVGVDFWIHRTWIFCLWEKTKSHHSIY